MDRRERPRSEDKVIFGWMGAVCLTAIVAIKLARLMAHPATSLVLGIAPSLLGPAGLLFLLLSSTGRLSRLSLPQLTALVAAASLALELIQLLPRPGILAHVHYAFDYWDLGATVFSVAAGYAITSWVLKRCRPADGKE